MEEEADLTATSKWPVRIRGSGLGTEVYEYGLQSNRYCQIVLD